jgi:microcystin-dependent protein
MNLSSLIPQPEKIPTGAVLPFAANSVPAGWLAANGAELLKTTYATLFAAIGITYGQTNGAGGAGTTHFRAPDLRGYFVRGSGTNSDLTASGTFGAKQADAVISHTHSGTTGNDSPDHTHTVTGFGTTISRGNSGGQNDVIDNEGSKTSGGASVRHRHSFTSDSMSPAGATETRPDNIAMLYCIKF